MLIALTILVIMLVGVYNAFSTSLYILSSTNNLWRAMTHSQNELVKWERAAFVPVSAAQGSYSEPEEMIGFSWERTITDITPLPNIFVRKVNYRLTWKEGASEYSYEANIYVEPK